MYRLVAALRFVVILESGEGASQFFWSLAFILMVGVIAIVVGPELSENWRDFVGRPLP